MAQTRQEAALRYFSYDINNTVLKNVKVPKGEGGETTLEKKKMDKLMQHKIT
jgi:hypothetical protein